MQFTNKKIIKNLKKKQTKLKLSKVIHVIELTAFSCELQAIMYWISSFYLYFQYILTSSACRNIFVLTSRVWSVDSMFLVFAA